MVAEAGRGRGRAAVLVHYYAAVWRRRWRRGARGRGGREVGDVVCVVCSGVNERRAGVHQRRTTRCVVAVYTVLIVGPAHLVT